MKVYECARVDVAIRASIAVVWRLFEDIEHWPDWTATVLSAARTEPGLLTLGASYRIRQPDLPERIYTVTSLQEQREMIWETKATGLRMVASHEVRATRSGSCVKLVFSMTGILAPIVCRWYAGKIGGMVQLEADSLRRVAEQMA
jgi:acyl-coenzyme A synthetase/AMP-(fatty) acid ligase